MQQDLFSKEQTENSGDYKFNRSKSIDELYREVKDHDIILTIDAPLATALNKRAKKELAITPRQLALKISESNSLKVYSNFELINLISRLEKRPLKVIHQYIESVIDMMNHSSSLEEVMEFSSQEERKFAKYFDKYPVIEKLMMDFDSSYLSDKKTAVINEEGFSLLESLFIPSGFDYTKVEIFTDEEYKIPCTYLFNSSKDMIEKTIDLLSMDNMNETAIVISPDSDVNVLLKSRLKAKNINTIETLTLSSENSVNILLHLIELGLRYKELIAGDIFSVTGILNISLKRKNSLSTFKELLASENNKRLSDLSKLLSTIETYTFSRFAEKLTSEFGLKVAQDYYEFLSEAQMDKTKISVESLIELRYLIQNFDKETGKIEKGVLFADPCSSIFIDRKNIIFLEMDNTWMNTIPERTYYNRNFEELKSFNNFKSLLQQGEKKLYFTKLQSFGEKTIPCYYFNHFKEIRDFNDPFFSPLKVRSEVSGTVNYAKILADIPKSEEVEIKTISPSSLKLFYTCPKKYEFSRVAESEDSPPMMKGNLIHDYAEMYFHHPVFCKENRNKILNSLTDRFKKRFDNINRDYAESEFAEAMRSIESFLNKKKFKRDPINAGSETKDINYLMRDFSLEKILSNTEVWIESDISKLHGKIDLLSDKIIVDFKSGYTKKRLLDDNLISFINECENEKPDFQAMSYIKLLYDDRCSDDERNSKSLKIEMIFHHMLCNIEVGFENPSINSSGRTSAKSSDKDAAINKVRFYNMTFKEFLLSEEFRSMSKLAGMDIADLFAGNYMQMIEDLNIPVSQYFSVRELSGESFDIIEKYFNTSNKAKAGPDKFLKYLIGLRRGSETKDIIDECSFFFFKEDLVEFSGMVKAKIEELNNSYITAFKALPLFLNDQLCKDCDYLSMCPKNILSNAPELIEI